MEFDNQLIEMSIEKRKFQRQRSFYQKFNLSMFLFLFYFEQNQLIDEMNTHVQLVYCHCFGAFFYVLSPQRNLLNKKKYPILIRLEI